VPTVVEVEQQIVAAMKEFAFTANDARVYVALLKHHPATGYELAARSGVPRSAIYTILRRLQGLGLVNAVDEKPARYVPLSPDRLLDLLESRFTRHSKELRSALKQLSGGAQQATTWTVEGYPAMLEQAERLVTSASKSAFVSLWSREAAALQESLADAASRGVDVVLFSFTPIPGAPGRLLSYGLPEAQLERHWPHRILLVTDLGRLLVGGADQTEENRAVLTSEPALVEMALSNLVLDITLFGERTKTPTKDVVAMLTEGMAPVDELLAAKKAG